MDNKYFYAIIAFYIAQRLHEVFLSNKNEKQFFSQYKNIEFDKSGAGRSILLHVLWFISLLVESFFTKRHEYNFVVVTLTYFVLAIAQLVRLHTQNVLKENWIIYPIYAKKQTPVTSGLYRYIRHPNYLAVMVEILLVPFLGGCWFTLTIFGILIGLDLRQKIKREDKLMQRLLGFLFMVFLTINSSNAEEVKMKYDNWKAASTADTRVQFTGESTKFGFVTTSFDGYAKEFAFTYDKEAGTLKNIKGEIVASSFDTDSSMRDEKMRTQTLEVEKYPKLAFQIIDVVKLEESETEAKALLTIRGISREVPVKIKLEKKDKQWSVVVTAFLSLKKFEVPDPSIAIAKVKDQIKVEAHILVQD